MKKAKEELDYLVRFPANTLRPSFIVFYEDMIKNPGDTFYEMQKFLRLPLIRRDDLDQLHKKSSDKPFIRYLKNLEAIQARVEKTEFEDMFNNTAWEERAPIEVTFKEICALNPRTVARWRAGACRDWTGWM